MNPILYLKNNKCVRAAYHHLLQKRKEIRMRNRLKFRGKFQNRAHGFDTLCIVLAGYKEFLYDDVFGRLKAYQMDGMDICVVSSGKHSKVLEALCEANHWSYLSTEKNNVSLVQNAAIHLHPKAKYIFKLDEDIFITEHFFEKMVSAYQHARTFGFLPGVMAPILPVNGYGHVRVLEKLGLEKIYQKKFGEIRIAAGPDRSIENDADTAKFFWGEGEYIPKIDELNQRFGEEPQEERACPIRFSIGAILFERALWEAMGYFSTEGRGNHLGIDEIELCSFCLLNSRPIMVSENILCGHFSFGPQTKAMKAYYQEHPERFSI